MTRTWHKGPPPHVGWWNASQSGLEDVWRWWDGECWSLAADHYTKAVDAGRQAAVKAPPPSEVVIRWTDYYPANARVPRIDPRVPSAVDVEWEDALKFATVVARMKPQLVHPKVRSLCKLILAKEAQLKGEKQ